MIRQKDLWWNYWTFHLLSLIGFLPLHVNVKKGRVRVLTRGWSRWLWTFWLANSIGLMTFKIVRLGQSLFFIGASFEHLCFTVMKSCTGILDNFWHVSIFIWNPQENGVIFNQLQIQDKGNKIGRKNYSIQEWLIVLLPFIFFIGFPITATALNIHGQASPEFLSSVLPLEGVPYICLFVHETMTYTFWMAVAAYGTLVQLAFIQSTKDDIEGAVQCFREGRFIIILKNLMREYEKMRETQLTMVLFNKTYASLVFAQKIYLITISTISWYGSISLFNKNPIQFCIFFYWAVSITPFFVILYDKGFKIPPLLLFWKRQVLIASKKMSFKYTRDLLEKKIESIANSGIKVGGFHQLERESTPNFLDFVLSKVVDLLVTFPQAR